MYFDDLGVRRVPADGRRSDNRVARDRYRIRISCQRRADRGARGVDRGHTNIAFEGVGAGIRQILNIETSVCRMVHRDLHGRVTYNRVSAKEVALDPGSHKNPICIADYLVVFDCVISIDRSRHTDSKIIPLTCISISTDPVRTEPVMACARQSYTTARSTEISVCD